MDAKKVYIVEFYELYNTCIELLQQYSEKEEEILAVTCIWQVIFELNVH